MQSSVTRESPIFIDQFHTEQTKKTGNEVNIFHITAPDANLSRTESTEIIPPTKIYKRRWLMLSIFVSLSVSSSFQWIQFSIITNLLTKYYDGIDTQTVNWTSLVYMVTYIPLIFPGAWFVDKMGLRVTLLVGALGTTAGAWIKVFSVSPDLFYVALIGQTVVAVSQVFILGVPSNIAAVWFGSNQVSSACSIGVFGNQLGIALGFLLPPLLVKDGSIEDIGAGLNLMYYLVAGFCTLVLIVVFLGFQAKPPLPPSLARYHIHPPTGSHHYLQSIKRILWNKGYVLLLITYGINSGVFYAVSTLLNQTVLEHFPGQEKNAGQIGLTIVVCGMIGSVLGGIILDRTHKFKETTLAVYGLAAVGMVAYTFTFALEEIAVTFTTAGMVGFFMTGYLPIGFEFAAELTYPEPEGTSSGLLNASAQVFGIVLTTLGGWLLTDYGDIICNGTLTVALMIGAGLTLLIRSDLKRQRAVNAVKLGD